MKDSRQLKRTISASNTGLERKKRTRSGKELLAKLNVDLLKDKKKSEKETKNYNKVRFQKITEASDGQRLDNFLFGFLKGVPKSHIYRVIRNGEVRINKSRAKAETKLILDDVVRIPPITCSESKPVETPAFVDSPVILYEDEHLLVVDKPEGLASHGGSGISYGLIERMRATRPEATFLELAHRLDRDTSGVIVMAKTRKCLVRLHEMMKNGEVHKTYRTLVKGDWVNDRQHIKEPLYKYLTTQGERRVRVDYDKGLPSHSIFNLIERFGSVSYLEVVLKTGRTHQIRVHACSQGYPLVGDDKYGDFDFNHDVEKGILGIPFKRMYLHAWKLEFKHPISGDSLCIECPETQECRNLINVLRQGL